VKKAEERSYALDIVVRADLDVPADAVELVFPMTRDAAALAKAWARAAAQTAELLAEGRDVAFLVEGDASTYSTFRHLARAVRELARRSASRPFPASAPSPPPPRAPTSRSPRKTKRSR